jgi:two-component system, LuxR family, sensor histidine kinase DctS
MARRWWLWVLLILLVGALLGTLVWLAGRYEASQLQAKLERDALEATADIRAALTRNVQSLQALNSEKALSADWQVGAQLLLRERRELLRVERRNTALDVIDFLDSPYRGALFAAHPRVNIQTDVSLACAAANRISGPAYSSSYFVPLPGGLGVEVVDMCLPLANTGAGTSQVPTYLLATYALQSLLSELVSKQLTRGQEMSLTEADGTRLALYGVAVRGSRVFAAQQLLDLPGNTMVLRMDSWRSAPGLFPNVLTALVTAMSLALIAVLTLLAYDMRRRLRAEHGLADALAFRKAMEDSLVTGLRARDMQGHITYVNPAFCQMLGFEVHELVGRSMPAPYWPPELIDEYQKRNAIRMAGDGPPREGYESVFMRKNGQRFPVLIFEAPLINAQGEQNGWMGAVLDISEQRRVEELSRASQERLQATARLATVGEMASLMSHELNQPLAAISSYATGSLNMLSNAATPSTADLQQAMTRIAEQAERAGKVIKSVHDFVRRRDQSREPIQAQALIDAVMPLVSLQARKLGVQVVTQIAAKLPPVLCDRTMVEQVLLNLARNGMQAMDKPEIAQRELRFEVKLAPELEHHKWLEFSVQDRGLGIAQEVANQLFTPFFTTKAEGMGLGLSLCRTVIEQHGGALSYEPRAGGGTVFKFTLPVKN